ncbi:MAG: hypothetical protein JW928_08890 [Candidatus Aureabacteria bacterium]|nr:hypothetical protein [Candidatus Auribacterota bacterium]
MMNKKNTGFSASGGKTLACLFLGSCLMFAGCETSMAPRKDDRGKEAFVSAPQVAFQPEKVKKDIEEFIESCTAENGLIASFSNSSPYFFGMDTGLFHTCYYGKMGYLEDQVFTYDIALAVIGLLLLGKREEAEQILDVFEEEFYLKKNGRKGFFNSYALTSRIPVQELHLGSDGDRIHAGPTLWVAIAALNHTKIVRNTRYLGFVLDALDWCRTELTYFRFPDGERGGVSMGFGWGPEWSKIFSTEHNIDYFAVLRMLDEIYEESPDEVRAIFKEKNIDQAWLRDEMKHIGRWLYQIVFDKEYYCFIAGVNEFGVDRLKILDGSSWGLGGVGPENFEKWGIDLDRLIKSTESYFCSTYELPNGKIIKGFDFTDAEGTGYSRDPLVWFEGTGQMIIAYNELSSYYKKKGYLERANRYRSKAISYTNDIFAFSYYYELDGALPYMAILLKEKQVVKTLKYEWEIPRGRGGEWVRSVSSTMWFLYAVSDFYNSMKWSLD